MVNGMVRPMPVAARLPWFCCEATMTIAPAQKNSVILPKACMAMCIPPPITPHVIGERRPQHHVGELAHRGVGEPQP